MKRFIIPGVLFLVIGVIVTAAFILINLRQTEASNQAMTDEIARQTQVAGLVSQQLTAMPTATSTPVPTIPPTVTPTSIPTPFGGGGQYFGITFDIINSMRQSEITDFAVLDLNGNIIREEKTSGSPVSVSKNRKLLARLVESGVEIFTLAGQSEIIPMDEVSSRDGIGSIIWLPGDSRLIVEYHRGIINGGGYYSFDFYLVDLQKKSHQRILSNLINNYVIDTSPDGYFFGIRDWENNDIIYNLDATSKLSPPKSTFDYVYILLGWNYNGTSTYWIRDSKWNDGKNELVRMDMTNGTLKSFGEDPDYQTECVLSNIEDKIFCAHAIFTVGSDSVSKVDIGRPGIQKDNDFLEAIYLSPDERKFVIVYVDYDTQDRTSSVYDFETGEVYKVDMYVVQGRGGWSPDGTMVYGQSFGEGDIPILTFINVDTREKVREFPSTPGKFFGHVEWVSD
jgi:hypothetical protein